MQHAVAVHPFHNSLVLVGGAFLNEENVAVFVGQIVPIRFAPTHVVDVQTAVGDVGTEASLGQKTNPCIGGAPGALAVCVGDGCLVSHDDVFVASRTADDAVLDRNRGGGGCINGCASNKFRTIKLAQSLAHDVRTRDGAAGD